MVVELFVKKDIANSKLTKNEDSYSAIRIISIYYRAIIYQS